MAYQEIVNAVRNTVAELDGDVKFQNGLTVDASLFSVDNLPCVILFPFISNVDITNNFYESHNLLIGFYDQDTPSTSTEEREAIIARMDVLSRDFILRLDGNISGNITGIRREPQYRQYAGTVSGYAIQLTVESGGTKC